MDESKNISRLRLYITISISFSDATPNYPVSLIFLFPLFFVFLSFFSSFFFFRYNSTTRILSSTWIPIVPPAAPLFFLPSFFYLELLIYRGHWRGSRRSVKSLNVMRCYYLRGRRLSKSGSGKVVMHTQRCYIHGAYTYSSLRRGRFLGRCRKTRDSTLV